MSGDLNELTEKIIGSAIKVHRELGPGLLESAYETCLAFELSDTGLMVERQKSLPVIYRGIHLECGYRLDLVVERKIILELKTVEKLSTIHSAQLLSYLKLSGLKIGLLMNFHSQLLKNGVQRIVNEF